MAANYRFGVANRPYLDAEEVKTAFNDAKEELYYDLIKSFKIPTPTYPINGVTYSPEKDESRSFIFRKLEDITRDFLDAYLQIYSVTEVNNRGYETLEGKYSNNNLTAFLEFFKTYAESIIVKEMYMGETTDYKAIIRSLYSFRQGGRRHKRARPTRKGRTHRKRSTRRH